MPLQIHDHAQDTHILNAHNIYHAYSPTPVRQTKQNAHLLETSGAIVSAAPQAFYKSQALDTRQLPRNAHRMQRPHSSRSPKQAVAHEEISAPAAQ